MDETENLEAAEARTAIADDPFERYAAEAEALGAEMRGEAPPGAGPQPEAPPPGPTNAEVITDMLRTCRGLPSVVQRFPRSAAVMADEVCTEVGDAAGALMDKYGWNFGGLGAWKVEIRALVVVGGFAYALGEAVNADIDALRGDKAREAPPGGRVYDMPPADAAAATAEGDGPKPESMNIKFG